MKRPRLLVLAGVLALIAGLAVWWWTNRAPSADQMMAWMPEGRGATLYVDLALMRQTGVLARIAGNPALEEPEYKKFVAATGFNYRTDLDAALVRFRDEATFYVLAGKFDDGKLRAYAQSEGGRCVNGMCSLPASTPGRQVSFVRLNGKSMAMAVSADPMAAALVSSGNKTKAFTAPMAPVWLQIPGEQFRATDRWPAGVSAFLQALRGAESAMLLLRPTKEGMDVVLDAPCPSPVTAQAVAGRLMQATALLKSLIEREGQKPDEASLSGVLTSGQFRADQSAVRGFWPLKRSFLEGMTSAK